MGCEAIAVATSQKQKSDMIHLLARTGESNPIEGGLGQNPLATPSDRGSAAPSNQSSGVTTIALAFPQLSRC